MATYASLTQTEKDIIDTFARVVRGFSGELAKLAQRGVVLEDDWDAQVSALIATLDPGEVLPDTGGLAGAADITHEELTSIVTSIGSFLLTYNTPAARQLYVKLAGPQNVING